MSYDTRLYLRIKWAITKPVIRNIQWADCNLHAYGKSTFRIEISTYEAAPHSPRKWGKYGAVIRPLFGFFSAYGSAEPLQVFFTKSVSLGSLFRGEFPRLGERPKFIDPLGLLLVKLAFHFRIHPPHHHVRHEYRPPQAARPVPPSDTENRGKHVSYKSVLRVSAIPRDERSPQVPAPCADYCV